MSPVTYDAGERTASAFFYWASRRIPNTVTKLYHVEDIPGWVEKVCAHFEFSIVVTHRFALVSRRATKTVYYSSRRRRKFPSFGRSWATNTRANWSWLVIVIAGVKALSSWDMKQGKRTKPKC